VSVRTQIFVCSHLLFISVVCFLAGLASLAVFAWTLKFTAEGYRRFALDVPTLDRMVSDDKFLCWACTRHHADNGYVRRCGVHLVLCVRHVERLFVRCIVSTVLTFIV